jgi:hypothetical protein
MGSKPIRRTYALPTVPPKPNIKATASKQKRGDAIAEMGLKKGLYVMLPSETIPRRILEITPDNNLRLSKLEHLVSPCNVRHVPRPR